MSKACIGNGLERARAALVLGSVALLLAGCGGGGGDAEPSQPEEQPQRTQQTEGGEDPPAGFELMELTPNVIYGVSEDETRYITVVVTDPTTDPAGEELKANTEHWYVSDEIQSLDDLPNSLTFNNVGPCTEEGCTVQGSASFGVLQFTEGAGNDSWTECTTADLGAEEGRHCYAVTPGGEGQPERPAAICFFGNGEQKLASVLWLSEEERGANEQYVIEDDWTLTRIEAPSCTFGEEEQRYFVHTCQQG